MQVTDRLHLSLLSRTSWKKQAGNSVEFPFDFNSPKLLHYSSLSSTSSHTQRVYEISQMSFPFSSPIQSVCLCKYVYVVYLLEIAAVASYSSGAYLRLLCIHISPGRSNAGERALTQFNTHSMCIYWLSATHPHLRAELHPPPSPRPVPLYEMWRHISLPNDLSSAAVAAAAAQEMNR